MAQIFHPSTNTISRLTIYGTLVVVVALFLVLGEIQRTAYATVSVVGEVKPQPVPFSHQHHAGGLGIDCRYCHTSVETSSFAGIPPTKTCMNCHSQIWSTSPMLEPVRESFRSGKSLVWTRLDDLPDFVFFDHSIHIQKGVGCVTCHGPVDEMALTYQDKTLLMEWCLDCHRAPEKYLRPRSEIFNFRYRAADQRALGVKLKQDYHVRTPADLTSCDTCHR